jgi:DNA mismatch repair ATPase MutS
VGKLGIASTFESEIEFAKTVLAAKERPMFVMMDEIFHSTNALDGVAASKVFLRQLYKLEGVVSIISTHYIQLATDFKESAQSLQLVTKENADLSLEYTYKVAEGVSDKSSVMEILKERGLLE